MYDFGSCMLCPRQCSADRINKKGFCGAPSQLKAARATLHFGEEPCISGTKGSGTVFFSGCNLRCVFCQNYEVSHDVFGKEISAAELSKIFLRLQNEGAHNINLVSGTPYVPLIIDALRQAGDMLHIPIVYNCGGYESPETIAMLDGYIDIYLPDFKYISSELSSKYSAAPDYAGIALPAIKEMLRQTGVPVFDENGILQKGTIIRHLVLPSHTDDSIDVLRLLAEELPRGDFMLSLMSQYTPDFLHGDFPELARKLTSYEYRKVVREALRLGLDKGYMQDRSSIGTAYTPHFGLEGIE